MRSLRILSFFYILTLLALFLYSFTQIDLSLTFSRITLLREIVTSFQYIGYFNRPLSTNFYLSILLLLYGFYIFFLYFAYIKKISKKFVWKIIIATTLILVFSYNAFSYDIFNYIFDAKIITHYHQNPYIHKALDFAGDPMLSFMRWTHRVYPYGPVWLVLTVPLSFIGFQFFLPTFFLFKMLMAASFLGSVYFIGKILQKIAPEKELFGLVFFGLSPLVIIESLVSAHLDIVMIFFALWALYLLVQKKYLMSCVFLAVSIGIKFVTGFLLPVFLLIFFLQRYKKKISWNALWSFAIVLMFLTVYIATQRANFQPWYLLEPLAFAVFLGPRYYILIPSIIISLGALLIYAPFLYFGDWNSPLSGLIYIVFVLTFIATVYYMLYKKFLLRKK